MAQTKDEFRVVSGVTVKGDIGEEVYSSLGEAIGVAKKQAGNGRWSRVEFRILNSDSFTDEWQCLLPNFNKGGS